MMRSNAVKMALMCTVAGAIFAGCSRRSTVGDRSGNGLPTLASLTPNRGNVARGDIVEVVVNGAGFDSLNTVHFGDIVLRQVPRRSLTTLRFSVPLDDAQRSNRGGSPPVPLSSGPYPVRVTTSKGESNALMFQLEGGRGANE